MKEINDKLINPSMDNLSINENHKYLYYQLIRCWCSFRRLQATWATTWPMADPVRGTGSIALTKKIRLIFCIFYCFSTNCAPKSNILIQNREIFVLPKFQKIRFRLWRPFFLFTAVTRSWSICHNGYSFYFKINIFLTSRCKRN